MSRYPAGRSRSPIRRRKYELPGVEDGKEYSSCRCNGGACCRPPSTIKPLPKSSPRPKEFKEPLRFVFSGKGKLLINNNQAEINNGEIELGGLGMKIGIKYSVTEGARIELSPEIELDIIDSEFSSIMRTYT